MFKYDVCQKVFKTKKAMLSHKTKIYNPIIITRIQKD